MNDVLRLDPLDLQIVVSGAEGPDLVVTAFDGPLGYPGSIGPAGPAAQLGTFQILLPSITFPDRPLRALDRNAGTELLAGNVHEAPAPYARGHTPEKLLDQRFQIR